MDIQMPVMDGYMATKAIRNLPDTRLASIPIIAMTANAFQEDKKKAEEVGMNGHITKPLDIPSMKATLQQVLKHAAQ
jgi:CheY-like chemotaxis protein